LRRKSPAILNGDGVSDYALKLVEAKAEKDETATPLSEEGHW
jgi:hypothetical protein